MERNTSDEFFTLPTFTGQTRKGINFLFIMVRPGLLNENLPTCDCGTRFLKFPL